MEKLEKTTTVIMDNGFPGLTLTFGALGLGIGVKFNISCVIIIGIILVFIAGILKVKDLLKW